MEFVCRFGSKTSDGEAVIASAGSSSVRQPFACWFISIDGEVVYDEEIHAIGNVVDGDVALSAIAAQIDSDLFPIISSIIESVWSIVHSLKGGSEVANCRFTSGKKHFEGIQITICTGSIEFQRTS